MTDQSIILWFIAITSGVGGYRFGYGQGREARARAKQALAEGRSTPPTPIGGSGLYPNPLRQRPPNLRWHRHEKPFRADGSEEEARQRSEDSE